MAGPSAAPSHHTEPQERVGNTLLRVASMTAGYGAIRALRDISLEVREGEIVTILGPNGAGKSTLMRTIAGAHKPSGGQVELSDSTLSGRSPEHVVRRGVSLVPEGRNIFGSLTVEQNLVLGASSRPLRETQSSLDDVYERFPILGQRRKQAAGTMSGGEQQQVAIARALMAHPTVILYDEPSLGLAPLMVDHIFALIEELRDTGITTVLVEQNAHRAIHIADWVYVLASGALVASGPAHEFHDRDLEEIFLGRPDEEATP